MPPEQEIAAFASETLFAGGGEMGAMMRAFDWSRTPLGPVEQWPQSLKTSVSICLNSRFAILVWWGPQLVKLYNDAYSSIIAAKHPKALGSPGRDVWPEIWDTIGPMLNRVMEHGEASWSDDLLLLLERNGYPEECYFTFSYSPIRDESGGVGGIFTPVTETTERVIGERRLRTLRDVAAAHANQSKNAEQACVAAALALAGNSYDLPFAAIYLFDSEKKTARLVRDAEFNTRACILPERIELANETWLQCSRLLDGETLTIDLDAAAFPPLPRGDWGIPTHQAIAVPIRQSAESRPMGFLFAGVSPRKRLDDSYRVFYSSVADLLARAIADARAVEREIERIRSLAELRRVTTDRFIALRATAEAERKKLHDLFSVTPAAIVNLSGPEHRITLVNERYLKLIGRKSTDDLLGKTIREALPEVEGQGFFELLDRVYETGVPFVGNEMQARLGPQGSDQLEDVYCDFVYQPTFDATGKIDGVLAHIVEVTERVLTRRQIYESEERYRTLFSAVPVAVFVCDKNAVVQHYNKRAAELWGREPVCGKETHCGSAKLLRLDGSVLPHEQSPIVEVLRTGNPITNVEVLIERPDGSRIPVLVSFAALRDEQGEITGAVTSFIDIAERKQAETAINSAAERFRFMMESMPQKVFTATATGEVDYFNARWMEFTGLSFEQIRDWGWTQFIHPDDVVENVSAWRRSIETGEPFLFEHRFRRADGSYRWHLSRAAAMRDAEGEIVMWIGSNTDIHDQKQSESALRESEKLAVVGRLASTIAHEINNPLESVTNLLYLMQTAEPAEPVRHYTQLAAQELARVSHIVTHTLSFRRQPTHATGEKLSRLLDSAVGIYQGRLSNSGIELRREYLDTQPVPCYPAELRQVFANLIGNAFDATRRGGRITVRTREANDWRTGRSGVRVTIADNGEGMDRSTLDHLFEPFFTTKGDNGTGLGLWVSAEILKRHQTTIQVKSSKIRSGTVFSLFFPRLTGTIQRAAG